MNNRAGEGRRRLAGPSSRGHRRQWSTFPQSKQRHADVQERCQQLQAENLELRSQNSDLARQLNDVRVKFQALQQHKRDLERRLAQMEASNRREKALALEAASATTTPPPPSPIGLKASRSSSEAATPIYRPAGTPESSASSTADQHRWHLRGAQEGVGWIEEQSPERVHARRGSRRASILPNTSILEDHRRRGRRPPQEQQQQRQQGQQGRTPSPPPSAIQPQSPRPFGRSASWSLAGDGGSDSDNGSSRGASSFGERSSGSGSRGRGDASGSHERSSGGTGGRIGSRSLELPIGGDMGGVSRSLELSGDGGDEEALLSTSAPTPASSTALLSLPSGAFHSLGGDGDHESNHDSGNANSPPPTPGHQLRRGRIASTLGWQHQRTRSEEATGAAAGIGASAPAAAATIAAATDTDIGTTTERGPFPPPPPGSPQEMPERPTSLASTPFPSSGSDASSSSNRLRPRRNVTRPVSYQEPSLNIKMRKGHVMFPKARSQSETASLSETGPAEEKENQR